MRVNTINDPVGNTAMRVNTITDPPKTRNPLVHAAQISRKVIMRCDTVTAHEVFTKTANINNITVKTRPLSYCILKGT